MMYKNLDSVEGQKTRKQPFYPSKTGPYSQKVDVESARGVCRTRGLILGLVAAILVTAVTGCAILWYFRVYTGETSCEPGSHPCLDDDHCTVTRSTYTCSCLLGYDLQSDLRTCTDIDECKAGLDHCQKLEDRHCLNTPGSYMCGCPRDYQPNKDGRTCDEITVCTKNPCKNGGICNDAVNDFFTCSCAPGFWGNYCQININECLNSRCENGATCRDGVNSYTCDCPEGYTGEYCEKRTDVVLIGNGQ